MNLAYSARYWNRCTAAMLQSSALETGFCALELYGESSFIEKPDARKTCRSLADNGIRIINLECSGNLKNAISKAGSFGIPYVCIESPDESMIRDVLSEAYDAHVTVLVPSTGEFADTKKLSEFLMRFSDDHVCALWDMHSTFGHGESAESTICNLGAYVKLVHAGDCDASGTPCLLGEGDLPLEEMMEALSSVNYDGFISFVWNPEWFPELSDLESVLAHFSSTIGRFGSPERSKPVLYRSKRDDGFFVYKKDALIDSTFSDVLDKMAETFPDQYAFKYTTLDYTRTYSEFRDDVDQCCRAFISLGIGAGSHVAVWASNVPQWFISFWAATKIGAVLVTVNTAYKKHELEYLLRQSDTHTLVMEKGFKGNDYMDAVRQICPELESSEGGKSLHIKALPFLRNIVTVGFEQKGCIRWEDALKRSTRVPMEEVVRLASEVRPQDVCNMQYTSGTTGFPKGVMLTHFNIVNNGKCIGDRMDLSTADRMMIQVPMFHCFGMVLAMTASMTHGASLMPLPYFSPKAALACINEEHITCFHGVPTMFIALLEHPDFKKTDFSHMRTGIMAGSPCPIKVMRDVVGKMNMSEITIVYGQTEASPGCTMSSTDDSIEVRVGTVGRPLPEIECRIIDPETGAELPDLQVGEFVARGYNTMKGYYKMPKATASVIDKDLWLHTGDLACRTPEGNYRITGRLKDMIIRGGENIYPKEIEEYLYTCPKVNDVQVVGVPDEQYGEQIMAFIILKPGIEATEDEIRAFVKEGMASHKVPRYVQFVDSFPMNVAGKILKYQLRDQAIAKLGLQKAAGIVTA
ncbi:MAG: AMP-binding protein [Sphaerochaetaceae bacterium]|jgi:fatty-acyl-CoA synthase